MNQHPASIIDPRVLLVASRALASLRPNFIAFLVANAAVLSGGMKTPISLCNVLFVGNLCAALTVLAWFGLNPILADLRQIKGREWIELIVNGGLAALLSGLIFAGLEQTTVTNAILLGRVGPVLYAVMGAFFLGNRINRWEWAGFSLIVVGVIGIVLKTNNFQINIGDLLILGSACVFALTSLLGKLLLAKEGNLRTVIFTRNFFSAIIFFVIAMTLFGPHHFADAFSGQLWIVMFFYAFVVIILSQVLWYAALKQLDAQTVGRWTLLSPIFGILAAFAFGERPSAIQIAALVVIMAGVTISGLAKQAPKAKDQEMPEVECTASAA